MKFSVLMSVYKNDISEYLNQAIESVLNQTIKPNEIVIVVDGSISIELKDILEKYKEKYDIFKIIYLKENQGLGDALRIGLKYCTYNIVARMDSDDISVPNRFEKQVQEFEKDKDLDIVGGQIYEFIDNKENIICSREVPLENDDIYKYAKKRCPFNHVTVMFKKDSVLNSGGYLKWYNNEDYYLWIRMMESKSKFKNVPEYLVYVRVGNEMYQRRGGIQYFKSEYRITKVFIQQKDY